MRILIAEDDFLMRKTLNTALRTVGEVDVACNGSEAWLAFQAAHEAKQPYDLVLLDMIMPGLEGGAVLSRIRAFETDRKIFGSDKVKVAMTTGMTDKTHVLGSFQDGCDAYIKKPYTATSVLEGLRREKLI